MEFKPTVQGWMIYAAMGCWIAAVFGSIARRIGTARILFFAGFLVAVVAWVYRWIHVQHVPMQNLFEVFLTLGMLIWPIWLLSRRMLGIRSFVTDILIGLIVLYPAGFSFHAEPQRLPPALQSWLFAPHVAVYMLSYVLLARAAVQAGAVFWYRFVDRPDALSIEAERATYQLTRIGFPLLTLGLLLGSVWGQRAWGDYWGWDPKELWSLATWLVYIGYFHFRYLYGTRHRCVLSVWPIVGLLFIIMTLLWVNLSRIFSGLHNYAS